MSPSTTVLPSLSIVRVRTGLSILFVTRDTHWYDLPTRSAISRTVRPARLRSRISWSISEFIQKILADGLTSVYQWTIVYLQQVTSEETRQMTYGCQHGYADWSACDLGCDDTLRAMSDWLTDCGILDDEEHVEPAEVVTMVASQYDGGISGFIADAA